MPHTILKERLISFFGGMVTGGPVGMTLLQVEWKALIVETPLKIFIGVTIAFMGGVAGLAGRDFYNQFGKKFVRRVSLFLLRITKTEKNDTD